MRESIIKSLSLVLSLALSGPCALGVQNDIDLSGSERDRVDRGEIIVRELETQEETGQTLEAVGLVNASRVYALETITDFESYHEFMPNVKRVERLVAEDTSAILNYFLDLPLGIEQKYRIEISWTDLDSTVSLVEWVSVDWPGLKPLETIRETHGFWLIHDQGGDRSMILYHVYIDPGDIPFGFGWIIDLMTESSFPDVFQGTKARIESR